FGVISFSAPRNHRYHSGGYMYHEKNIGEECIFHDNVSVLSRKPLSLQRDLNIYTIQSEERRETGEQMPPHRPYGQRDHSPRND
ncbi:MAG: hypothetical protein MR984_04020, partial [Bacteroidales bacterium]|nr:hypothetical protein [Bacteroidales bacterium]